MKIVIDLNEVDSMALSPNLVYRSLRTEYAEKLQKAYHIKIWGLETACDSTARELYSHMTGRKSNVKNLLLTYSDAEKCFELFKLFADVWAYQIFANGK